MSTFSIFLHREGNRDPAVERHCMNGDGPGSKLTAHALKRARAGARSGKTGGTCSVHTERQRVTKFVKPLALGEVLERELSDRLKSRGYESLSVFPEPRVRMSLMVVVEEMLRGHDVQREHLSDFGFEDIDAVTKDEVIEKLTWLARAIEGHYAERDVPDDMILSSPRMLRNAKLLISGFVHRLAMGRSDGRYQQQFKAPIMENVMQWTPELRQKYKATMAVMKDEFERMGTEWTPELERTLWSSLIDQHKSTERKERMMLVDQLRNAMPLKGNWTMAVRQLEPEIV